MSGRLTPTLIPSLDAGLERAVDDPHWLTFLHNPSSVNSIFNPSYVDFIYSRPTAARRRLLADAHATNYSVVRLDLLEQLYARMYNQRRELGPDEAKWPHRILGAREIVQAHALDGGTRLRIAVRHAISEDGKDDEDGPVTKEEDGILEELDLDLVISATGYGRTAHVDILRGVWDMLPEAQQQDGQEGAGRRQTARARGDGRTVEMVDGKGGNRMMRTMAKIVTKRTMEVRRDYSIRFTPGALAAGAGVWLLGCSEGTHGVRPSLGLILLSFRSL